MGDPTQEIPQYPNPGDPPKEAVADPAASVPPADMPPEKKRPKKPPKETPAKKTPPKKPRPIPPPDDPDPADPSHGGGGTGGVFMYPRGQSSYYRHKTKIVIGGGPAPQSHYDAGEVWPKKIPLEGSPRLAIAVPYVLDNVGRGLRPRSGFTLGTLRHQFTKDKPPVIQVSGYKATDIVVSSSLYNVFFTLESNGNSTPGIYDISIEDGGVTINLKSNDPGTSLTVSADPQVGLASLHVSSIVAADSIFAAASSLPARADFMAAFTPLSALNDKMLEPVLDRLRALSDPERARILREVLPIVDVMFRKTSRFAGRDDSFWDYDATLFDTEDRGGLQSPAAERDWNDVGYFERADTYTDMLSAWDDMAEMETTPLGARWLMRAIGCLEMLSVIPCEDTTT